MDLNIRFKTEFIPYIGIGLGIDRTKKTELNPWKVTISLLLPFMMFSVTI
tara:strand:- start:985 stop:1134 length:150 start_codon:yes stop_codon:yes gene_type:complete